MGSLISTRPASVVFTDGSRVDVGELTGARLDMEVGDTDDFQLTCPSEYEVVGGSLVYVDGTSWGGIVDHRVPTTGSPTTTYRGRTWAGVMAERIVRPPAGQDYYEYDCDANALLSALVSSLGLGWLFSVPEGTAGIRLTGRFDRYTDMWSGIRKAARAAGARVSVLWGGLRAELTMVPRSEVEADPSHAPATVDEPWRVINHLVCLGQGELADRVVIDLYADADGNVSQAQSLFGPDERAATYDYSNADAAELLVEGTKKLRELQERSSVAVDASALEEDVMLGDMISAVDDTTGASATAEVTRLVVRVEDGQLRVTCEAGEAAVSGGSDSSGIGSGTSEPGAATAAAAGRSSDAAAAVQELSDSVSGDGPHELSLTGATVYGSTAAPTYEKVAGWVHVCGAISPASTVAANGRLEFSILPEGYRPRRSVYAICHGSHGAVWMLIVASDGTMTASRYRDETGWVAIETWAWLPFSVTFPAA